MRQRQDGQMIGTRQRNLVDTAEAAKAPPPKCPAAARHRAAALIAAVGLAGLAACTGSSSPSRSSTGGVTSPSLIGTTSSVTASTTGTPSASSQTTTPPPRTTSPGTTPVVKAAEQAYARFNAAYIVSERMPRKLGQPFPKGGDFTKYSFAPYTADATSFILFLSHYGLVYRGTAPVSRVVVVSSTPSAKPPQVVLSDCPTSPASWQTYNVSNGKIAPIQKTKVPPPYNIRVVMAYQQARWGVLSEKEDATRTCHR